MRELVSIDAGRRGYRSTLGLQHRLLERVRRGGGDRGYVILVEHDPPVITMGRRAAERHVLAAADQLAARGTELIESTRGGDVTWHGVGQLVAYPIVALPARHHSVRRHVRDLEEAVIRVLAALGIDGQRHAEHVGVWVGGAKIAAVGVAVSRRVTYHGLALNVGGDLRGFDAIVPCGIRGAAVTSISRQLGREVPVAEVKDHLVASLADALGFESSRAAAAAEFDTGRADGASVASPRPRLPRWLRKRIPAGPRGAEVRRTLEQLGLATVCRSANCPNQAECFARGTATFMILGDRCTRSCRFCAVEKGTPRPVDAAEGEAVAEACCRLALRHVVITSVTRDDLPDGGADHFARVVRAVRGRLPRAAVEILTPDFRGDPAAVDAAVAGGCDVFNHNVETVPRLYPAARPEADYRRSLGVLARARRSAAGVHTKSGLMVGLGETRAEIRQVMRDLRDAGCEILTVGQYLSPSPDHLPVARFVEPAEFAEIEQEAKDLGFAAVAAGPFVRSSYHAEALFRRGHRPSVAASGS